MRAPICKDRPMASDRNTVAFIVDQLAGAGDVSAKPMFGEYGVYCDGRMVAMVCDDQLFVKPTPGGRAFAGAIEEASPYPGAKPCLLVDADRWDDADWLADLVRISTAELPLPKPKKPKVKKV
jgi:TfoX/Sxy family transcriptional regulator of competence genes